MNIFERAIIVYQVGGFTGEEIVYCDKGVGENDLIEMAKKQVAIMLPGVTGNHYFRVAEREDYPV